MCRDITGTDTPFGFAVLSDAPEGTGFDVVFGIGNEDILGLRMDHHTIGHLNLYRRVVEPLVRHDLAGLGVDDVVGGVGGIIVSGAGIERVAADIHVADVDSEGVNDLICLSINTIELRLYSLVVAMRRDPADYNYLFVLATS